MSKTLYVIAYDIPSDRRRTKVHNTLSGYGKWTQYSLFECHLTDKQNLQLRQRLAKLINEKDDSVRFYPLCAGCAGKVETIGGEKPKDETTIIV